MIQNDYRIHYLEIIEYAKSQSRKKGQGEYLEDHHIIPDSMGGSDEPYNMVLLTPEEHFKCHILLPYFTEGQDRESMIYAWNGMSNWNRESIDYEEYSDLREAHSKQMSGSGNPKFGGNKGEDNPMFRKTHTKASKELMSEKRSGGSSWCKGLTKETSESLQKLSNSLSIATKGKPRSQKHKDAVSKAVSGSGNPRALKINIYNDEDILMYECYGNFEKICKENGLPVSTFHRSWKNNGSRVNPQYKKHSKCINWYAQVIP